MNVNETLSTAEVEILKIVNVAKVLKLATIAPDYTGHKLEFSEIESVADIIHDLASSAAIKIAEIYPIKGK